MEGELHQVLMGTLSPDANVRQHAQHWLDAAKQKDLHGLASALAQELRDESRPPQSRMQAGIQLKNCLVSQHDVVTQEDTERWKGFSPELRAHIKNLAVSTLGTETGVSTAAQVVASVATIEVPNGEWPDVIQALVTQMNSNPSNESLQVAVLDTMGFLAESLANIGCDALAQHSNTILSSVVERIASESTRIKKAAILALTNALDFCKPHFEVEQERDVIMTQVCHSTQSDDDEVKVAALQCLVKVVSLYYQHMEKYMGPALFPITMRAMRSEDDRVILQAVEFWSSVAEEEAALIEEMEEAFESGRTPDVVSKSYVQGASQEMLPMILELLAKQDESDDEDDWTPSKAASVCLSLIAECCRNNVLAPVVAFVQKNISNQEWQYRDASVMAFGAVLEGPDEESLSQLVSQGLPPLAGLMTDPMPQVQDSVAWLLGRVCETTPEVVLQEQFLGGVLQALGYGIDRQPRVAANVCWAFNTLAESAYKLVDEQRGGEGVPTYPLSPHFNAIVEKLLAVTERPDANERNLRLAAYEAIMNFMQYPPEDCYETIKSTAMTIMPRLEASVQMTPGDQDSMVQAAEIQSLLTATLQHILRSLKPQDAAMIGDRVIDLLVKMIHTPTGSAGNVQEDTLMTMSALIEALGEGFLPHVPALKDFILSSLNNVAFYQVCFTAVGVVGDLFRQLGSHMLPFCNDFMSQLVQTLSNPEVNRIVKPQILATFGDVALACGKDFSTYLQVVVGVLQSAAQLAATGYDTEDYDEIDYVNELREGILEAFTGIIQALSAEDGSLTEELKAFAPHINHLVNFMMAIVQDDNLSEGCVRLSCGIVGDVSKAFGVEVAPALPVPFTDELMRRAAEGNGPSTHTMAKWMNKQLRAIRS